jgi:hypothetical protein
MIRDALQWAADKARDTLVKVDERDYSTVRLNAIHEPECSPLTVHKLMGLCDYLEAEGIEKGVRLVNVLDYETVVAFGELSGKWRQREVFIRAETPGIRTFDFGSFMSIERAIIQLRSRFVPTNNLDLVIKEISSISAGRVSTSEDDGIAQTVKTKVGVTRKGEQKMNPIVRLRPFRTFPEVSQPSSDFLLRLRGGGEESLPEVALFEADGGVWKIQAMEEIRGFLAAEFKKRDFGDGVDLIA